MKKKFEFEYDSCTIEEMDEQQGTLIHHAIDATHTSYAPYSGFNVGCAILLMDGTVIKGSNMENAAYSSTICAERTALSALHNSKNSSSILKIAITFSSESITNNDIIAPCGECRQVIAEFASKQAETIEIILYTNDEKIILIKDSADLLPFFFGSKNLK